MKKLTTAKIWQFAAGQFGWAMLSGIISNWLVYFYQRIKRQSVRTDGVYSTGTGSSGDFYDHWRNLQRLEEFSMHLQIL